LPILLPICEPLALHAGAAPIGCSDGFFGPFPQKPPGFPVLCIARTIFSRFFDHRASIAGIYCVVDDVGILLAHFTAEIPGLLP
jgi:hypothetical protein